MAGLGHALEEVRLFTNPADLAMLEADLLRDLKSLYRDVLAEPLARLASSVRRLLVVPCDVLHTLPLGALHDDDQHVLERYALTYLPSASLMGVLPERGAAGAPLIVANSWGGCLPQVRMEAERVARALVSRSTGSPSILIDESATSQALREAVPGAGLIHIAAHGAFRDDAPLFSSLQLADGPLTVSEVYGLDLSNSALVTLSGCQTGVGQGLGGEMLGLTQAFFFAGAPRLVASRWRVADETTAQLMEAFYAGLSRGETVADALRAAQLGIQAQHPHAGYWAAFAVWGRGFIPIFGN
jgi:CHAT domain-containing protein